MSINSIQHSYNIPKFCLCSAFLPKVARSYLWRYRFSSGSLRTAYHSSVSNVC